MTRAADMRYVGQEHPVTVQLPPEVSGAAAATHSKGGSIEEQIQRYGTRAPEERAEIVSPRDGHGRDEEAAARAHRARRALAAASAQRGQARGLHFAELLGKVAPRRPTHATS